MQVQHNRSLVPVQHNRSLVLVLHNRSLVLVHRSLTYEHANVLANLDEIHRNLELVRSKQELELGSKLEQELHSLNDLRAI